MILCLGTTPTVQRTMRFKKLVLDEVNRATEITECASGKSINVARVLHQLGEATLETGFLGGDSGAFIRHDLDRAGVPHDFLTIHPKTRTCTTVFDESNSTTTELVEEHAPVEPSAWDALLRKMTDLIPRAKVLVLSGSLPPGAPQDFYADCVKVANAHNVRVILDARNQPLWLAMPLKPFLVKPNRSELAETVNASVDSDDAMRDAIRKLIAAGPQWAVITAGAQGAIVSDGKSFWKLLIPKIQVVNPIGSGDSLAAGIAAALVRGQDMPHAAILGAACGVANALTPLPGHVRPEEVQSLLNQVRLEPW